MIVLYYLPIIRWVTSGTVHRAATPGFGATPIPSKPCVGSIIGISDYLFTTRSANNLWSNYTVWRFTDMVSTTKYYTTKAHSLSPYTNKQPS